LNIHFIITVGIQGCFAPTFHKEDITSAT